MMEFLQETRWHFRGFGGPALLTRCTKFRFNYRSSRWLARCGSVARRNPMMISWRRQYKLSRRTFLDAYQSLFTKQCHVRPATTRNRTRNDDYTIFIRNNTSFLSFFDSCANVCHHVPQSTTRTRFYDELPCVC